MKIERAWLHIIVSAIVAGVAGFALFAGVRSVLVRGGPTRPTPAWWGMFFLSIFLPGPIIATVLAHMLTPKERLDGETRCRKCGYILKGLTEPRCSECGERI